MGYRLVWEGPVVTRVFSGCLSFDDMVNSMNEVEGHPGFDQVRHSINDFLSVTRVDLTEDQVEELAAIDRAAALTNPRVVVSVVATDPEILKLSKAYTESALAAYPVATFGTLADARRAAGLEDPS